MKARNEMAGAAPVMVLGGIGLVIAVVIAVILINWANDNETDQSPRDRNICFTKCIWFTKYECGSNRNLGFCILPAGCGDGVEPHTCGE